MIKIVNKDVKKLLQKRIQELYLGEQPIGTSLISETNHVLHPFIPHSAGVF
ncbi:MAG: hypothetical protein WCO29_21065 [Nostocales cyanobacterium ELA583]